MKEELKEVLVKHAKWSRKKKVAVGAGVAAGAAAVSVEAGRRATNRLLDTTAVALKKNKVRRPNYKSFESSAVRKAKKLDYKRRKKIHKTAPKVVSDFKKEISGKASTPYKWMGKVLKSKAGRVITKVMRKGK